MRLGPAECAERLNTASPCGLSRVGSTIRYTDSDNRAKRLNSPSAFRRATVRLTLPHSRESFQAVTNSQARATLRTRISRASGGVAGSLRPASCDSSEGSRVRELAGYRVAGLQRPASRAVAGRGVRRPREGMLGTLAVLLGWLLARLGCSEAILGGLAFLYISRTYCGR